MSSVHPLSIIIPDNRKYIDLTQIFALIRNISTHSCEKRHQFMLTFFLLPYAQFQYSLHHPTHALCHGPINLIGYKDYSQYFTTCVPPSILAKTQNPAILETFFLF